MRVFVQLGVIFCVYWVGQCVEGVLPFSFPASVIGLLLLVILLLSGAVRTSQIRETADFLLAHISFFFIPTVVGIMEYASIIWAHFIPFLTVCVVSTFITYGVTVGTVRLVRFFQSIVRR